MFASTQICCLKACCLTHAKLNYCTTFRVVMQAYESSNTSGEGLASPATAGAAAGAAVGGSQQGHVKKRSALLKLEDFGKKKWDGLMQRKSSRDTSAKSPTVQQQQQQQQLSSSGSAAYGSSSSGHAKHNSSGSEAAAIAQ
jgi:hypothetical protein